MNWQVLSVSRVAGAAGFSRALDDQQGRGGRGVERTGGIGEGWPRRMPRAVLSTSTRRRRHRTGCCRPWPCGRRPSARAWYKPVQRSRLRAQHSRTPSRAGSRHSRRAPCRWDCRHEPRGSRNTAVPYVDLQSANSSEDGDAGRLPVAITRRNCSSPVRAAGAALVMRALNWPAELLGLDEQARIARVHPRAAAFSSTCSGRLAPTMAEATFGSRSTQASENCVRLQPALAAMGFSSCTRLKDVGRAASSASRRPWARSWRATAPAARARQVFARQHALRQGRPDDLRNAVGGAERDHLLSSAAIAANIAAGWRRTARRPEARTPLRSAPASTREKPM